MYIIDDESHLLIICLCNDNAINAAITRVESSREHTRVVDVEVVFRKGCKVKLINDDMKKLSHSSMSTMS